MKMKVKMRQVFGIILSLVLVLGLMPWMSLTAYAYTGNPYEALVNTTTPVTFNGMEWYIIADDSTATHEGSVTLLVKECIGSGMDHNPYADSDIRSTLDNMTKAGGTFEGVADAILSVDFTDEGISGAKLYLPSYTDLNGVSSDLLKCSQASGAASNRWWTRTNWGNGNWYAVNGDTGEIFTAGSGWNWGVRPALKLDLSKVTLDSNTNTFTMGVPTVDVASVTLNKNSATLSVGDTETLTATVSPDDATDKTFTWSSDNTAVATVSNGVVTAVSAGTANITVTATNGTEDTSDDKTATCAVKVNAPASSGDSSDSGSGSSSGGSSDSGNTSGGTSSDSSDNTNTNTDTSAKVPYDDVPISTGSVNDITGTAAATAESNPFGTKIENNSNLTTLLSLTDAEVAQGVNVWLDIQDMSASVSQTDKTLIQNTSGDYTVGMYLDINLFKKVGNNDATKVSKTNGKIKASIVIPKKLRKSGRIFEIIRVHNGKATTITGKYTKKTHVFTFETDKFSTYAIAYKDASSSTDSESTDSSSSATTTSTTTTTTTASTGSTSTTATAPKTGDASDMRVWLMFVMVCLGGFGVLVLSKKKEN